MKLRLDGIEVDCIIGERPDERTRTQRLRVDVELDVPALPAETDDIRDAVDYAELSSDIRKALVAAECRMIERAAKVVCDVCRGKSNVGAVKATVTKYGAVEGLESASAEWTDGMSAATTLVELLKAKGLTCATAESCTGGGVGAAITDAPGASEVFLGGVISYSNDVKSGVLGVRNETLGRFGAVSKETAAEMAEGVRALIKSDIAVSVTGIAGPGGGSPEKPVGLVWFGVASKDGVRTEKAVFAGDRAKIRRQAVLHAIGMLTIAAMG